MAAPIWEEEVPASPSYSGQEHDDDDVPLSFSNFMSGNGRNHAASGVRRSHTVTATGSRLHRISSGNSGSLSSSSSSAAATSNDRPLSASTGVSRRTSIKATSPSLNRVVEGSTSEEEAQAAQEQYPSNAYLPFDADVDEDYDNQALYGSATASLARHSSMPVSRAFRREASNPGAPWQRTQYRQEQQQPISPPLASASSYNTAAAGQNEQRIRSNSTAAEVRGILSLMSALERRS